MSIALSLLFGLVLFLIVMFLIFWFFAAYFMAAIYASPISVEVYAILSFEFETIDEVYRKVRTQNSKYLQRALNSFAVKVIRLKEELSEQEFFEGYVDLVLRLLEIKKEAEISFVNFDDGEDMKNHPILRQLTEEDKQKYRKEEERLQRISGFLEKTAKKYAEEDPNRHPIDKEFAKDLKDLSTSGQKTLHAAVFFVRKLPGGSKPKFFRTKRKERFQEGAVAQYQGQNDSGAT